MRRSWWLLILVLGAALGLVACDGEDDGNGVPTATFPAATATPIGGSAPIVIATSPPASARTYVVRTGDTLYEIALRHGTSVEAITAANNLADAASIYPGQTLIIPDSAGPLPTVPPATTSVPASPTAAATRPAQGFNYTVQMGDTLYSIALRFGTTVDALQLYNGIADPSAIQAGQTLFIPGVESPPPPTFTPAATNTPAATSTPAPTNTPVATSTPTPVPPTATPAFPYTFSTPPGYPNCSLTQVFGYISDVNGNGLPDVQVHVTLPYHDFGLSYPSSDDAKGPDGKVGFWDMFIGDAPEEGTFDVWVESPAGQQLSPRVQVSTDTDCVNGVQTPQVDFQRTY